MKYFCKYLSIVGLMAVAAASCRSGSDGDRGAGSARADQLVDGAWEFRVDRAWSNTGSRRSNEVAEREYQPAPDGATFPVLVSDHGSTVTIGAAPEWNRRVRFPLKGSRTSVADTITYHLDEGTFAGGRFVVWPGDQGLQGELTIYGSGLPIVASVRGRLSRNEP